MVDLKKLLTKIGFVSDLCRESERIADGPVVRQRQLPIDAVQVGQSRRIYHVRRYRRVRRKNVGACARLGEISAVNADRYREDAVAKQSVGDARRYRRSKTPVATLFSREKEECTVPFAEHAAVILTKIEEIDRAADRSAIIVVPERCSFGLTIFVSSERRCACDAVRQKVVGIESLVTSKDEGTSTKVLAAGTRDNVDLAAAAASGFSRIKRSQNAKLADRINARIGLNGDIRTAVGHVSTIYREGILARTSSVDRDVDGVRLAVWIGRTDVYLIGKIVRNAWCESDQLDPVSVVDRDLANLIAGDHGAARRRSRIDGKRISLDRHDLVDVAGLEGDVYAPALTDVDLDIGLDRFFEIRRFDRDRICTDREIRC